LGSATYRGYALIIRIQLATIFGCPDLSLLEMLPDKARLTVLVERGIVIFLNQGIK